MESLASFGRGYSYISAIIVTIISILFFLVGWGIYGTPNTPKNPNNKKVGMLIMIGSIFITAASWGVVYLSNRYQGFADYEGLVGGINIAKSVF